MNDARKQQLLSRLRRRAPHRNQRGGFILIVVLVTVILLTLSTYTFCLLMVNEQQATKLMGRQIQSRYVVESGVDYMRLFLSTDEDTQRALGGRWHNPTLFQNKIVSVNPLRPTEIGRFSVMAHGLDLSDGNPDSFRCGVIDESSKLNLNTLTHADTWLPDTGNGGGGRQLLMSLPGMTEDIADAILDWLDEDEEPRTFGIENYSFMAPPYGCKNGPMDSIEELLLVRGVTPQLLFGLDSNHNGILDLDEQYSADGANTYTPEMQLGWANYLTLFSKESNLNPRGQQRININGDDLEQMVDDLRAEFNETWINFIIAYRQNGPAPADAERGENQPLFIEADSSQPAQHTFTQLLDLIDAKTTLEYVNDDGEAEVGLIESPITMVNLGQTLPLVMEFMTTIDGDNIPGRINIMQAPRAILSGIPGMNDQILEDLISYREFELDSPDLADQHKLYETWILVERIVDLPTMKAMMPFICCGGDVYKAEIVGYFDDNVATSRAEVILDTTIPIPRILFWRDKSHLQRGYTVDTLGTDLNLGN